MPFPPFPFPSSPSSSFQYFSSPSALKQEGDQVHLVLQLLLDLSVACSYDLLLYPFDVQECGLTLELASELTGDTHWDPQHLHTNHNLPQPALYGASSVRLVRLSETEVRKPVFMLEFT